MGETVAGKPVTKRRFGCLLGLICGLAVIGLALGLGYFVWYSNARSELDAEIARIEARGEPLWFKDLAPKDWDPEQDGTEFYLQALAKIQAPSPAVASALAEDSEISSRPDALVIVTLTRTREVRDLLAECMRKRNFRLRIDCSTTRPFPFQLAPVQSARGLARVLSSDVSVALSAGERGRAIETVGRMF